MNNNLAQMAYNTAVEKLLKYCEEETDFADVNLQEEEYPFRVQFVYYAQPNLFRVADENGEIHDLVIEVGLSTTIESHLDYEIDAKVFKKLIKLTEHAAFHYYHAFREKAGTLMKEEKNKMIIFNILLAMAAAILFLGVVAEKDEKRHGNITIAFVIVMAVIALNIIVNAI